MFIHFTKSKNYEFVELRESYRDENQNVKTRIVQKLGRRDILEKENPGLIEEITKKLEEERRKKAKKIKKERVNNVKELLDLEIEVKEENDQVNQDVSSEVEEDYLEPCPELRIGHFILNRIWEQDLGLKKYINSIQKNKSEYDINKVLSYLCSTKIIEPSSIKKAVEQSEFYFGIPLSGISLTQVYRSLDFLNDNKDRIFKTINKKLDRLAGEDRQCILYYDVTNTYFESPMSDKEREKIANDFIDQVKDYAYKLQKKNKLPKEAFDLDNNIIVEKLPSSFWDDIAQEKYKYFRMRGPSKEHRFDLPIITIALIIDSKFIPIDCKVYAGNKSEFSTMDDIIDNISKSYNLSRTIVVADRGLNSSCNLNMLQKKGSGFLFAQKISNLGKKIEQLMFNKDLYTPFDENDPTKGGYQVIDNYIKTGSTGEPINCTLLLTYDEKRARRDHAILDAWVELVKQKMEDGVKIGRRRTGWAALAKVEDGKDKTIIGIDETVLKRKQALCGYAGMVYLPPKDENNQARKSYSEIAGMYKQLNSIEDCFRTMKSNLGLRPIYLSNATHIKAHVYLCVIALIIIRLIQYKLSEKNVSVSTNKLCETLKNEAIVPVKLAKDNYFFFRKTKRESLRKLYPNYNYEELEELVEKKYMKLSFWPNLTDLVKLSPTPLFGDLKKMNKAFNTKFKSYKDAVAVSSL